MDTASTSSPPALTQPVTALTTHEPPRWTPARQSTFLRALASSQSVKQAARAAGMSRQSAYALRARLKGEPFDTAWTAALRCRFDALAEAALERALNGVEVPHFYRGELVGTSRRYDERLTVALLLMREKFRPAPAPHHTAAAEYSADDFAALVARVEHGPETWEEEDRERREALYADYADEDEEDAGAGEGAGDAIGEWPDRR